MIWRRLILRSDHTIADLHYAIQIAMGWSDAHLNRFHIHGKDYGVAHEGGLTFSDNPDRVRLAARALMRIVIEQIRAHMKHRRVNEAELARRMATSRSQVHRLLSPEQSSATVETLVRAPGALEGRWNIQLVSAK